MSFVTQIYKKQFNFNAFLPGQEETILLFQRKSFLIAKVDNLMKVKQVATNLSEFK